MIIFVFIKNEYQDEERWRKERGGKSHFLSLCLFLHFCSPFLSSFLLFFLFSLSLCFSISFSLIRTTQKNSTFLLQDLWISNISFLAIVKRVYRSKTALNDLSLSLSFHFILFPLFSSIESWKVMDREGQDPFCPFFCATHTATIHSISLYIYFRKGKIRNERAVLQ